MQLRSQNTAAKQEEGKIGETVTTVEEERALGFEWNSFQLHPVGTYLMEFTGWKPTMSDGRFGKPTPRVLMLFVSDAPSETDDACEIGCFTAPSFHPKGKVRPFLEALGVDVNKIDLKAFALNTYVGSQFMGTVVHEDKEGGGKKATIAAFNPVPPPTPKAAAPKRTPALRQAVVEDEAAPESEAEAAPKAHPKPRPQFDADDE